MKRTVFLWINILALFFVAQLGGQKVFQMPNNKIIASDFHYLSCSSDQLNYKECFAGGNISNVTLYTVNSRIACLFRKNWGYYGDRIWVDQGCKAIFQLETQPDLSSNVNLNLNTNRRLNKNSTLNVSLNDRHYKN